MRFTSLFLVAVIFFVMSGSAFADMNPVKSFEDRQPKTHNENKW